MINNTTYRQIDSSSDLYLSGSPETDPSAANSGEFDKYICLKFSN